MGGGLKLKMNKWFHQNQTFDKQIAVALRWLCEVRNLAVLLCTSWKGDFVSYLGSWGFKFPSVQGEATVYSYSWWEWRVPHS